MNPRLRSFLIRTFPSPILDFGKYVRDVLLRLMKSLKSPSRKRSPISPIGEELRIAAIERFPSLKDATLAVDGMTSVFSITLMDSLLSFQQEESVSGHMIEFGVYKGRSAVLLGLHADPTEKVVLVDVTDYFDRRAILAACPRAEFVLSSSVDFKYRYAEYPHLKKSCRFVHIDSSHQFNTTFREMEMAEQLVQPGGIVVLDDYANLNYSQIPAAMFKYLYTKHTALMPFLITNEKAYLCRKNDFLFYGEFVLRELLDAMAARGGGGLCLARTDMDPDYNAFYLRGQLEGEGNFYGPEIFAGYYKAP